MDQESEEAINKRCQSQLAQAQSQSGNKYCADCDARLTGSVWTSWNLGIFICIQCSAKHRGLGAHISKVRSVCEDSWNQDQVAYMQAMGNSKSRSLYEAGLDPNFKRSKLQNDDDRQEFIRDKYVNKRWILRSSNAPGTTNGMNLGERHQENPRPLTLQAPQTSVDFGSSLGAYTNQPTAFDLSSTNTTVGNNRDCDNSDGRTRHSRPVTAAHSGLTSNGGPVSPRLRRVAPPPPPSGRNSRVPR